MSTLVAHAAWVLLVTFAISLAYEFYRATAKAVASWVRRSDGASYSTVTSLIQIMRLLASGRVQVKRLDERGCLANVRGDSGLIRRVVFDTLRWPVVV